ncbi:MAG: T9SS type A sorting domain-containing protein [Crocinitomicaceae bacterium]|nr:T9SS type A sorting domain-containing protein [Crocinitomicaceae bacterium]
MHKILFSLFSTAVCCGIFAQETATHCSKRARYSNQLKISPYVDAAQVLQQKKYDVTFYRLDLNMTNTTTALSGVVEIQATAVQAIDSALLEFYSGFTINAIEVDGVPTPYSRYGSLLSIPLNRAVGDQFVVSVDYAGTPPTAATNPLGGSGMTNASSPSWGNQVTWSLSEPFSTLEWFPCKQDLKDKADSVQVSITVPDHLMAGSNGVLDSVTTVGGFKTFHWMHRHPIAYYLISVAVASYQEYTVYANPAGSPQPVMIQNFIYDNPQFLPFFQQDIDETVDFIELFADLYGPYPFQDEKYGHCVAPLSGGMEHQTMTTQGFFERSLTAHELAHQWWGNHVTCGSWADIWINEGFASYSEYLMLENLYSFNTAQTNMNDVHTNVMSQPGGSTWVADSLNESAIFSGRLVYDKGGAIVHTLRYLVDDDAAFFELLKGFQIAFANSTATGLEFKSYAEQATGLDLTDFFNQWYFGEGYPTYSVQYNATGTDVNVLISQTVSRPAVTPLFTNPVDVRIVRSGGLGDTIVRVNITSAQTVATISGIENFVAVNAVDPLNYIINKTGTITQNSNLSVSGLQQEAETLVLYPNPTEGQLTVIFSDAQPRTFRLIDQKGKLVMEQQVTSRESVNLSGLSTGQYLVEVIDSKQAKMTRKVIKK